MPPRKHAVALGTDNTSTKWPVCARCLQRRITCDVVPTRHREILLCSQCRGRADTHAWLRWLEANRDRLWVAENGRKARFIPLELAIELARDRAGAAS